MVRTFGVVWAALSSVLQWPLFSPAHDTFELQKSWGVYSPFHAVEEYTPPPAGCEISQVNILHRHGARLPSEKQSEDIIAGVKKLQSVQVYTDSRLDFLNTFVYSLGENLLVPLGAIQSFESGKTAFERYSSLVTKDDIPFVRFAAASDGVYTPHLSLILNEGGNDTLQDNNCPNAASSHKEMSQWLDVYGPPITARLNSWAPGADLRNEDIHGLMMLCAFHTVASVPYGYVEGNPLPFSPFCSLFTPAEFEAFAYSSDVDRYYSTGQGGRLGRVQGSSTTLRRIPPSTPDPATFPLNRTVYADFTHDTILVAVFNTLGLFPTRKLSTTHPKRHRAWRTSEIMTFSSRMVVEKLTCDRSVRGRHGSDTYVRILVNEVVQPLKFCGAKKSGPWKGLCQFDAFLESQAYARNDGNGDWEKCFE
ncbi:hypothetical protein MVEN_01367800 [Mycena venus]|uniref:Phytase A n=1 Tax=Mycena venus TaxID=2733690 RepID=A0A8H6XVW2_9AGAR|nr:hypothetical protein MVEN_01367800 [Mycena venus]